MYMISLTEIAWNRLCNHESMILMTGEKPNIPDNSKFFVYQTSKEVCSASGISGAFKCVCVKELIYSDINKRWLTLLLGADSDCIIPYGKKLYIWFISNCKKFDFIEPIKNYHRNGRTIVKPPIKYMEVDEEIEL